MSNIITSTDNFESYSGSSVALYDVAVDNTAPVADNILVANTPTTAGWINGAVELKNVGSGVIINTNEPTNQVQNVLQATSSTNAVWTPFSNSNKLNVRAATADDNTAVLLLSVGSIIDGVVLADQDRILVTDNFGSNNGIWVINSGGSPTRPDDFASGSNAFNAFVTVDEGDINRKCVFYCDNEFGSDIIDIDTLIFRLYNSAGNSVKVNNIFELKREIEDNGTSHIQIISGTYTFGAGVFNLQFFNKSNMVIEGIGNVLFETSSTSSLSSIIDLINSSNITFRNINFNLANANDNCIRFNSGTCSDIIIDNCNFTQLNVSSFRNIISIVSSGTTNNITIKNCSFSLLNDRLTAINSTQLAGNISNILINNCNFSSTATNSRYITSSANNVIIKECTFDSIVDEAITLTTSSTNSNSVIISDCIFDSITDNSINLISNGAGADHIIISNCIFESCPPILANSAIILQGCHFNNEVTNSVLLDTVEASYSLITNNAFRKSGTTVSVNVGANCDYSLIGENAFAPLTITGATTTDFITFTTIASSNNTALLRNNNAYIHNNATNGTFNLNSSFDAFVVDGAAIGAKTINLADLPLGSAGHFGVFRFVTGSGDYIITPNTTSISPNRITSWTTVSLTSNDSTSLQWTGIGWKIFNIGTGSIS